jgi:hypothetical protein
MKNILFAILICLPFAINAQSENKRAYKYEAIDQKEDGTNKEFYANYKQGIAHYNKGVDVINKTEPDGTIGSVDKLQEEATAEFKAALPFLEKAYSLNSKNEKVLIALQGVYFALADFDKSDRYKKEQEILKKK